ncbi:MAG: HNH endonuclease signature motif containing protein [Cyanobacteria bacterium J06576_12]
MPKKVLNPGNDRSHPVHKTAKWRRASERQRRLKPLCEVCSAQRLTVPADHADHVIRLRDDGAPYDPNNIMSLCASCHGAKSAMERGGYRPPIVRNGRWALPYDKQQIINDVVARVTRSEEGGRGGIDLWI